MTVNSFLHRHAEALEHVLGYRTERGTRDVEPSDDRLDRFTIALSREVGTPEQEVAREVGERLGWPVYNREVPARIAEELHMPLATVADIDERRQSWLLECLESFGSRCELSEGRYFRHLVSVIRSLAAHGRCVIVGRGAAFILPPHSTLRVRLVGDREHRISAFARVAHTDRWTATRRMDEINRERSRFLRDHFHIDPAQPDHYDLVLNTSRWSVSECADVILRALHNKAVGHPTK
jgi:cytidylate kinase